MNLFKIEKMDLLVAVYIFCIAVSELMGAKTFPLIKIFGYQFNASVAIFAIPLVYLINDVVIEVLGLPRARSIVRSGLFVVLLILLFSLFATALPPSVRFAPNEKAYQTIFSLSARISGASLIAFIVGELTDLFVFSKLRLKMGKQALWFRNLTSNVTSEFLDTAIFMTLAFYALNLPLGANFVFLGSIILPYWLLKCGMSVIETPFIYWGVKWLRPSKKS